MWYEATSKPSVWPFGVTSGSSNRSDPLNFIYAWQWDLYYSQRMMETIYQLHLKSLILNSKPKYKTQKLISLLTFPISLFQFPITPSLKKLVHPRPCCRHRYASGATPPLASVRLACLGSF